MMWQRYIRWIDRDLGNGWPKMNGLSSLMPFVPLALAVVYDFFVHPNETPGTIEGTIVSVAMAALATIWGWRVYLRAIRQYRIARFDQRDD